MQARICWSIGAGLGRLGSRSARREGIARSVLSPGHTPPPSQHARSEGTNSALEKWKTSILPTEPGSATAVRTTFINGTPRVFTHRYHEAKAHLSRQEVALGLYNTIKDNYAISKQYEQRTAPFDIQVRDAVAVGQGEYCFVQAAVRVEVSAAGPLKRGRTPVNYFIR